MIVYHKKKLGHFSNFMKKNGKKVIKFLPIKSSFQKISYIIKIWETIFELLFTLDKVFIAAIRLTKKTKKNSTSGFAILVQNIIFSSLNTRHSLKKKGKT